MAMVTGPATIPPLMAIAAFNFGGFSAATQDVVIDAIVLSLPTPLQALMLPSYIAGYRIGMLMAGGGIDAGPVFWFRWGEYDYLHGGESYCNVVRDGGAWCWIWVVTCYWALNRR